MVTDWKIQGPGENIYKKTLIFHLYCPGLGFKKFKCYRGRRTQWHIKGIIKIPRFHVFDKYYCHA